MSLGPLIIGIAGTDLDAATAERLAHPAVGGVILFARNFRDPEQLAALCQDIRKVRRPRLLICADQEGGRVQRFREGFTPLPPLAVLGRWHAERPDRARDLAYRHARVMAAEVLGHGVDLSLAPVLDLAGTSGVIGDRALAADPEVVADLGAWYIAGMADAGMAACGKHFPGHGSVAPDTHVESVRDERSLAALAGDMVPFERLAQRLGAVMMAHVSYPAVDARPAGFSPVWIREHLHTRLEFAGAVWCDDLDMAGAASAGDTEARLRAALDAGCDLVPVCDPDSAVALLEKLDDVPANATDCIGRLYGRAQFALAEQLQVPEFRAWRDTLRSLV